LQFTTAEVEEAFHSFDLDGNNFVGAGELRQLFNTLGEQVTDEEVFSYQRGHGSVAGSHHCPSHLQIDEMIAMVDADGTTTRAQEIPLQ